MKKKSYKRFFSKLAKWPWAACKQARLLV